METTFSDIHVSGNVQGKRRRRSQTAAGDLTSDGTHSYTWDTEGRLLTMDGGTTANMVYNALENRGQTDGT